MQPVDAVFTPAMLYRPALDLGNGHEGNQDDTPGELRIVALAMGWFLKRNETTSVSATTRFMRRDWRLHGLATHGGLRETPRLTPPRARNLREERKRP